VHCSVAGLPPRATMSPMQHTLRGCSLAAVIGAFALLLLPHPAHAATVTVVMTDDAFTQKSVTVNVGDTVTWVNQGSMAHTVTADNGSFDSSTIQPGQQFSATFNQAGTFAYHCKFHGGAGGVGMSGTVAVATAAANTPAPSYVNPNANYFSGAPAPTYTYAPATSPSSGTAAQLYAQVQTLLAQISALQAAQGGVVAPGSSGTVYNSSACPLIGRSLSPGSTGSDVTSLQQYLISVGLLSPTSATGFYGPLTQAAVQQWQVAHNIVSSGTPATTGYGVVGPRTAAAISLLCTTAAASAPAPVAPVGGFIQVTPISGTAPLTVSVRATINTANSCVSATYTLDFGDGTPVQQIQSAGGTCQQQVQTYQHTYIYGGTYQITLSAGSHTTNVSIAVTGPAAPGTGPTPTPAPTPTPPTPTGTISAFTTSGNAPLTVNFYVSCASGVAYNVVFGDGTDLGGSGVTGTKCGPGGLDSITHTYTAAGTFTAQLVIFSQQQNGTITPTNSGSVQITVTSVSANYSYNPPQLSPGATTLAFSAQFDLPTSCTGFDLSWGDGTADSIQTDGGTSCAQTAVVVSRAHTYAQAGTYTLTLRRGANLSRTDTVAVTVTQ